MTKVDDFDEGIENDDDDHLPSLTMFLSSLSHQLDFVGLKTVEEVRQMMEAENSYNQDAER